MDRKQIQLEAIRNYSFEELTNTTYTNPDYSKKLSLFSNWELLNLFRKRTFADILLKLLSLELEEGISSPPKTNAEIERNQFLTETIRELLIFPSDKSRISVLVSDPKSFQRIKRFIENNNMVHWQVPRVLIDYFLNLETEEIYWGAFDKKYMNECRFQGSASSYNAGSRKLALIQRGIENGLTLHVRKEVIHTSHQYQEWMKKNYPSFIKQVEKRNQIQIIG